MKPSTLIKTHSNLLAVKIYDNKDLLLPTKKTGRAKGAYNKYIFEYCLLISECLTDQRDHKYQPYGFDLGGTAGLDKRFNKSETFDSINTELGVFFKQDSYSVGKYNKSYTLNQFWLKRLTTLLDIQAPDDKTQSIKWQQYSYNNPVTTSYVIPDINALTDLYYTYDEDTEMRERNLIYSIVSCYHQTQRIEQFYDISGGVSGRLWTQGITGLQQLNKKIRRCALNAYTEYDLKAAAYAILLSLANKPINYPTIKSYVDDTQAARLRIATNAGVTIEQVKLAFLHKSFGSALNSRNEIYRMLGANVLEAITKEDEFSTFCIEFKRLTNELKKTYDTTLESVKEYRNSIGETKYAASFMAKLYQDREREIIELIRTQLQNPEDCLLLHDGIFSRESLDTNNLESLIKKTLGINIYIGKK